MAWSIKNIENQVSNVEGAYTLTYSIEGMPTIKKHELSTNNGVFYKEITPVGNLTGFSVNVEATSELKNCYIRCTDSEGHSQTSNLFTVQFVSPSSNNPPTISNIKIQNVNQSGVYQIVYEVTDDSSKDLTHYLKIDNEGYKQITTIKSENTYTYNGTSLSNGTHVCNLKVSDGIVETESSVFQIIIPKIVNTPPKISEVTVEETSYKGRFRISYTATDIDKTDLITHKLKIDTNEYEIIKPISVDNKYVYNGLGLTEGTHEGIIQISDGVNEVSSSPFSIVINAQEGVGLKQQLSEAKGHYDTSYNSLMTTVRDVIDKMTNDKQYDNNIGASLVEQAYKDYTDKSVKLKDISQQAIDLIGSKKTSDAKENLAKEIGDLTNSLGSLDQSMNDVFKDGILTEAEKITIRQHLQSLSLEKVDVDNQYNSILGKFNKTDLDYAEKGVYPPITVEGTSSKYPDKKWYLKVYKDFQSAYESYSKKYENLILIIDYILKKDGILDDIDKNKKDKAFEEYTLAIGEYSKQASLAIEAIGRNETENNETLIQTFKGEYVRTNRENSAKLTALTQTTNGLTEQVSEFKQTADRIQTQVTQNTNGLASQKSEITQLANKISSKVSRGDVYSIIEQSSDEILFALNNHGSKGTWIRFRDGYAEFVNCHVALKSITCLDDEYPIIYLYSNKNNGRCSIDATKRYNVGIGEAIRLKWDDSNYILVSQDNFSVYGNCREETAYFNVNESGVYHYGSELMKKSSNMSFQTIECSTVRTNYLGYNGSSVYLNCSMLPDIYDEFNLGDSKHRYKQVCTYRIWAEGGNVGKSSLRHNDENNYFNDSYIFFKNYQNNIDILKNSKTLNISENINNESLIEVVDIEKNDYMINVGKFTEMQSNCLETLINKIEALESEINNLKNGGNQ